MENGRINAFSNHDRVSHERKGLGTVRCDPARDDLVPDEDITVLEDGVHFVFISWDDDRLPVEKVQVLELEILNPASSAISSGY